MDTLMIIVYFIGYLIAPIATSFLDHYVIHSKGKPSSIEVSVISILWPLSLVVFIFSLTFCVIPEKIYNYVERNFFKEMETRSSRDTKR